MARQVVPIFPREVQQAEALGSRLRTARLRRRLPLNEVASRVGVSRPTLRKLEDGDPAVSLGVLIRTLTVLGLATDTDSIAANDVAGQQLADIALPGRPNRRRTTTQ
jgi:transcriptional regulator with XRE-family HTH domain